MNEDALDPLSNDILAKMTPLSSNKKSHELTILILWNQMTNLEITRLLLSGHMNMNMYEYVNS